MDSLGAICKELRSRLATERDELRVQLHLMKADVQDDWQQLERKWERFESKMSRAEQSVKDSAEDVEAATAQLAEELQLAYRNLRKSLK